MCIRDSKYIVKIITKVTEKDAPITAAAIPPSINSKSGVNQKYADKPIMAKANRVRFPVSNIFTFFKIYLPFDVTNYTL